MKFTNSKRKPIARLLIILGKDSLEEVFISQLTMSMLLPLRYYRLRLARMNKIGGRDRRAPNNSGLKYSIKVPRNAKEAAQFDQENGNLLWTNAILK